VLGKYLTKGSLRGPMNKTRGSVLRGDCWCWYLTTLTLAIFVADLTCLTSWPFCGVEHCWRDHGCCTNTKLRLSLLLAAGAVFRTTPPISCDTFKSSVRGCRIPSTLWSRGVLLCGKVTLDVRHLQYPAPVPQIRWCWVAISRTQTLGSLCTLREFCKSPWD
jgi:hypothetical protein